MTSVQPAIGSPGEGIQGFMRVLPGPAVEQDLRFAVRLVVAVRIRIKQQMRSRAHIDPAKAHLDATGQVDPFHEGLLGFKAAVTITVLEDDHPILALALRRALGIGVAFHHPDAPACVKTHRNRLGEIRLGGDQVDGKPFRQVEALERFLGRQTAAVAFLRSTAGHFPQFRCFRDHVLLLPMNRKPSLVRTDDVQRAIAVEVRHLHADTHAGVVVDQMRHKLHAVRRLHVAKPVDHRLLKCRRIVAAMRHPTLSRDEVIATVTVDVGQFHAMRLAETDAVRILDRTVVDHVVPRKPAGLGLLKPRDAVAVRVERGDQIVVAITVHIIDQNLRAPTPIRHHGPTVLLPGTVARLLGLLIPHHPFDDVQPAIPIDIPHTHAVTEGLRRLPFRRHRMPHPRLGRILTGRVITVLRVTGSDEFRQSTRNQIDHRGCLVAQLIGDHMHRPVGLQLVRTRIHIKPNRLARKPKHHNVVQAVAGDVVDVAEEVVRVHQRRKRLTLRKALLRREVRARKPKRPVGDVWLGVAVDVANGRALSVEVRHQPFRIPSLRRQSKRRQREQSKNLFHSWSKAFRRSLIRRRPPDAALDSNAELPAVSLW